MNKDGVFSLQSDEILKYIVNVLENDNIFKKLINPKMAVLTQNAGAYLPDLYFPDLYLEQSMCRKNAYSLFFLLNSYERNYINHRTGGAYFASSGVPKLCAPEDWNLLSGLCFSENGILSFSTADDLQSTEVLKDPSYVQTLCSDPDPGGKNIERIEEILHRLSLLPVHFRIRRTQDECEIIFTAAAKSGKQKYILNTFGQNTRELFKLCGCAAENIPEPDQFPRRYGVPYYSQINGYEERIVTIDPAYFKLIWKNGTISDCRAGILISEKRIFRYEKRLKPMIAFQWHITDECDQRCKHCYLFGEDAKANCVSTPWDQMIHTLNEMEQYADSRGLMLMLAVSGGDPILHPLFWNLAEEFRKRGVFWIIMGNPFHLNADVCRRLRQAGCNSYQLSLDGLEPFHDYLRKPGSFQATLEAIRLLNDADIKSQLMATASRQNLDDIIECMDLAVKYKAFSFVFARYCATSPDKAEELYPDPWEYREFLLKYYRKKQAYEDKGCKTRFLMKEHLFTLLQYELGDFKIPQFSKKYPDRIFDGCHLGAVPTILSNGDLLACRRMESTVGNIKTMGISEACSCESMKKYREVKNITKCKDCELLNWCRGCRAVGFNATGDLHAQDPCCWK